MPHQCAKFHGNRWMYGWDTDDLAHFCCPILQCRVHSPDSSQWCVDRTAMWQDIGQTSHLNTFVSEFRYRAAFSNMATQSRLTLKMMPNFTLFDSTVKFTGAVARSLSQLLILHLRTNLQNTFDLMPVLCTAAECDVLIRKERKVHQRLSRAT